MTRPGSAAGPPGPTGPPGPPGPTGPTGPDLTEALVGFARTLRVAGVEATPDRVQAMLAAVSVLGIGSAHGTYWAGRLALCGEPDDLPVYDAAFAAYFGAARPSRSGDPRPPRPVAPRRARKNLPVIARAARSGSEPPDDLIAETAVPMVASDTEVLRHRDVAALSPAERVEVRRMVSMLSPLPAARTVRRYRPARSGGLDPRRTLRRILRHGGEPTRAARRRRRRGPRRLVLLLDISGSMTPYADTFLRFAHAAVRCRPTTTEVFTIGTRLTRITRPLRARDPDAALRTAGTTIPDWQGGTRLADSLRVFLGRWGQRGMAHGAVVVLASDGWERGDPAVLAEQLARLARLSHRLVWVNPHRGRPGYVPLAGGMSAALPYLDDFVAGHSLADLEEVLTVIRRA